MNLGFLAHDTKKQLIQNFCIAYKPILSKHVLLATGATGQASEDVVNLKVHKFLSGELGGEHQMASMVEANEIDAVFFFREPGSVQKYDTSFTKVYQACDTHNIPLATNLATAELLIKSLDRGDLEWREIYN